MNVVVALVVVLVSYLRTDFGADVRSLVAVNDERALRALFASSRDVRRRFVSLDGAPPPCQGGGTAEDEERALRRPPMSRCVQVRDDGTRRMCTHAESRRHEETHVMMELLLRERGYRQSATLGMCNLSAASPSLPSLVWLRVTLPTIERGDDLPEHVFRHFSASRDTRVARLPGYAEQVNVKDTLAANLRAAGVDDTVAPRTYRVGARANDVDRLIDDDRHWRAAERNDASPRYILKPAYGGRGAGISIIERLNASVVAHLRHLDADGARRFVVQRYIQRPLLALGGRKFTMRTYVLVTSLMPLRAYVHRNGIVKFAAFAFADRSAAAGVHAHITNAPSAVIDDIGVGENASLPRMNFYGLRARARAVNVDFEHRVWPDVRRVLATAIRATAPAVRRHWRRMAARGERPADDCCFQLLGADVDLDDAWRATFIEANVNPSMGAKVPFERVDKRALVDGVAALTGIGQRHSHARLVASSAFNGDTAAYERLVVAAAAARGNDDRFEALVIEDQ